MEKQTNTLTSLRRYDEAIECYNKALELSPNNPDILGNMSLCYGIKGDTDKALKCIEDAKKYSSLE